MKNKILLIVLLLLGIAFISGCTRSSVKAAWNLDIAAEEFELPRRIAAINGITDKPLFEIIGHCSIETAESYVAGTMEIICKIGEDQFTKDFVYLSDNVLIVVEQLEAVDVPQYHYQIVFAPQTLLPIPKIIIGKLGE